MTEAPDPAKSVVGDQPSVKNPNAAPSQNPLSRKLKKILESRLDNDRELVEALKALSTFFDENTLRARRNLRGDVEKRSLEISENFEAKFKEVKNGLDQIDADVRAMNKCCQEMTERLQKSKESTSELIEKTTKLKQERKQIELQSKIAETFLDKYQLKPAEMKVLRLSKDAVVTDDFFNALARTKEIHQNCRMLLRSNHQTAGLEIMESMALYQETSFEKLYRWAQEECRGLTGDIPDVSGALCRSMAALEDRQVLLKYTLDEYATARRGAVVRCFIDALTRGGPGGTPRPIELYSHDPVRYIGDILGWLHQAIAGERELLHSLLRFTKMDELKGMMFEIFDHIMEGICRPFKVRVEQVITSETSAPVLFKIASLQKFYSETLSNLFDGTPIIITTIDEMKQLSSQLFYNNLSHHGSKLSEKIDLPPPDLSPSESVNQTLNMIKDVLSSHDSAITSINERHSEYQKIFSCVLDPLVHSCTLAASRLNVSDMATFMLNCLYQVHVALSVYEFTDIQLEAIGTQMNKHTSVLVTEQVNFVLNRSGLGSIVTALGRENPSKASLSSLPDLDPASVKSALSKFGNYLSNPDNLNMPQLELIKSTRVRDTIRQGAIDLVLENYVKVHKEISDENNYDNPQQLGMRTPEEVRLLLN